MQRRILIIDDHEDLVTALKYKLGEKGHQITYARDRTGACALGDLKSFDLIVIDLENVEFLASERLMGECVNVSAIKPSVDEHVRAFKVCAANYRRENFQDEELRALVAEVLEHKAEFLDRKEVVTKLHEKIEFEVPTAVILMDVIVEYLVTRVEKIGVTSEEESNLRVALSEAFVNAVKHGNKYDPGKAIHVSADISAREARFTIEDEGEGFDASQIPDPRDSANLFKPSGRGVLIIQHLMDEVSYSERGNRLTMVKRGETGSEKKES
jgi:serine/threonine-protein kinase RsbW